MPKTAISFNVPPKLWEAFKKQTDELFLSRAPFLDYMVANELPHLRTDLAGLKLSLRAKRHTPMASANSPTCGHPKLGQARTAGL